jgi:hypothetical protein
MPEALCLTVHAHAPPRRQVMMTIPLFKGMNMSEDGKKRAVTFVCKPVVGGEVKDLTRMCVRVQKGDYEGFVAKFKELAP